MKPIFYLSSHTSHTRKQESERKKWGNKVIHEKITYRQQYTFCGKPNCRHCREGRGHGPYWYAYISKNGQTVRKYIGKQLPPGMPEEQAGQPRPFVVEQDAPLLKVFLLGQFRLERRGEQGWQEDTAPGWQYRSIRALLAYLLTSPGRRRGRDQVMDALWPNLDIENAANRLNSTVHQLRQLLEPDLARAANSRLLRVEPDILLLAGTSDIWLDVDDLIQLNARVYTTNNPSEAEQWLEEAAQLYGGEFLQGERSSEWVLAQREVYQRIWIGLLLELTDRRMARNELSSALDALYPVLAADSTNEATVCRLMLALTQLQRQDEALQVYQRLVTLLKAYHGADPLPETTRIFEAIRTGKTKDVLAQMPFSPKSNQPTEDHTAENEHRETPPPTQGQVGRSHQSPFVGRTEELSVMRNMLHALEYTNEQTNLTITTMPPLPFGIATHSPLLLLKGETGIGKTRLAEELSREAIQRGWSVAWSRCYEQESDIPYHLWIEVLRKALVVTYGSHMLQLHHNATRMTLNATFGSRTIQHLSTLLPELHQVLPENVTLPSLLTAQEQLHLWEATRSFLSTLSLKSPLLIVLDDIQWADGSSLELLAYLTRRLHAQSGQRILLLGTCRDTELEPTHPLRTLLVDLQREQAILTLNVRPLTNAQIGTLIAPLPEPIVQHIQQQAAGNPFFAEELARYSYATLSEESTWKEQQSNTGANMPLLPETITAALERRLNNLSIACQRLLGKAAVLGGSFEFETLRIMEYGNTPQQDDDTLLDLLDEALQAGVLTEENSDQTIVYHFWHPMIVSHLYKQLSAARRSQLHRRAAEALQQLYQDEGAEGAAAITQHLLKGGGSLQQIAFYAEIAGNRAYALSAYPEARHHYLLAIAHIESMRNEGYTNTTPPTPSIEHDALHLAFLHERVGECMLVQGHYEDAYSHYEQVLSIRSRQTFASQEEQQREAQLQALLWYEMGRASGYLINYERDRECNQRGEQVLREAGITKGVAWACLRLQYANICLDEGNFAEAREAAMEALHLFEATLQEHDRPLPPADMSYSTRTLRTIEGDRSELGKIYEVLGIIAGITGHIAESLSHLHTALSIFEQHNNIRAMANVCNNIGTAHLAKAAYTEAEGYFRRSLQLAERVGDFPLVSTVCVNLGEMAANTGNLLEAEEWYRRSLKLAEQVNLRSDIIYINNILATNLQEQGNLTGAYKAVRRSLMLGREIGNSTVIGPALIMLAHLRLIMAEELQAKVHTQPQDTTISRRLRRTQYTLQQALALQGLPAEDITKGRLAQATLFLMQGNSATAETIARETLALAQQQEQTYFIPRAQCLLGCCLALHGHHDEADDYFRQAMQVSQQNGMRLEYARVLYYYGAILLQRGCPQSESFQTGVDYLQQAQDIFDTCYAAIDLERVRRILADPTQRLLPFGLHLLLNSLTPQSNSGK